MQDNTQSHTKAVASLVLGILSLVVVVAPKVGGLIGLLCAIVGLILGLQARKQAPSRKAVAGIVLCLIAIVVDILAVAACGLLAAIVGLSTKL